jgi:hypothetical protein
MRHTVLQTRYPTMTGSGWTELSGINFTKSPASVTGNVSEARLMSQVRRVCEIMCKQISVFLQSEQWRCQYLSAYIVAAIM